MHVLVGIDDSDPAWAALEYALEHHPDAALTLLHVVNPADSVYGEYAQFGVDELIEERRERGEELLEEARERAADHGGEVETVTTVGLPAETLVEEAEARSVDQIVVGSHGRRGVSRVLLGSVAETVARRAAVPVTVVR